MIKNSICFLIISIYFSTSCQQKTDIGNVNHANSDSISEHDSGDSTAFFQGPSKIDTVMLGLGFLTSPQPDLSVNHQYIILDLSFQNLNQLPQLSQASYGLQEVWLTGNGLTHIPSANWFAEVKTLELSQNRLSKLPALISLTKVESVTIDYNELSSFPIDLCSLLQLKQVSIRFNNITKVPDCICQLTSLESLWLNGNEIVSIPGCLFKMPNLETLFLPDNRIEAANLNDLSSSLKLINLVGNPVMQNIEGQVDRMHDSLGYNLFMK